MDGMTGFDTLCPATEVLLSVIVYCQSNLYGMYTTRFKNKKQKKQTEKKTTKRADTGEGVPNKLASVYP